MYEKGYADAKRECEEKLRKILNEYGILDKKYQDTSLFEDAIIGLAYPNKNRWKEVE